MTSLWTPRLRMRAPTADDGAFYAAFYEASDVTVGGYRGGRSPAEVAEIHARDMAHWQSRGYGMFLLFDRKSGAFLGGTGLAWPDGWPCHELTWFLMPAARGKGYAREASLAVIDWAHETLGWTRVETHMRDENAPARHLAEAIASACGGREDRRQSFPDGVTRDVYLLSERARDGVPS